MSGRTGAWRLLVVALASAFALAPAGCDSRADRLAKIADAAPTAGLASTKSALLAGPRRGMGWLNDALIIAGERLQAGEDATVLARAVLEIADENESGVDRSALFFVRALGATAHMAADRAYMEGDLSGAEALVLAGSKVWASDQYWLANPAHDCLVSLVWFRAGREREAIERLSLREGADAGRDATLDELRRARPRRP